MNRKTLDNLRDRTSDSASRVLQPFNLVVIYDEQSVATASKRIIFRLLDRCLPQLDIHKDEWSSVELAHPEFAREAIELAVRCDMLVVATMDDRSLPSAVISCLSSWKEQRAKMETALVWVVASEPREFVGSPLQGYFQELARGDELSFFAAKAGKKAIAKRPTHPESPLFLYQPHPEGWGINE